MTERGKRKHLDFFYITIFVIGTFAIIFSTKIAFLPQYKAFYEREKEVVPEENITIVEKEILKKEGYTEEGKESKVNFAVKDAVNLTAILTWIDDFGSNDVFSLQLLYEGKEVDKVEGSEGKLSIYYSEKKALSGNFTIVICAVACPGEVSFIPVDRDNGNDWNARVSVFVEVREE
ncbi:MAG: hypothetical protein AB1779_00035 [Candidatus Thermoplasmatota archaeon]